MNCAYAEKRINKRIYTKLVLGGSTHRGMKFYFKWWLAGVTSRQLRGDHYGDASFVALRRTVNDSWDF
jgi:hypothetical protein